MYVFFSVGWCFLHLIYELNQLGTLLKAMCYSSECDANVEMILVCLVW